MKVGKFRFTSAIGQLCVWSRPSLGGLMYVSLSSWSHPHAHWASPPPPGQSPPDKTPPPPPPGPEARQTRYLWPNMTQSRAPWTRGLHGESALSEMSNNQKQCCGLQFSRQLLILRSPVSGNQQVHDDATCTWRLELGWRIDAFLFSGWWRRCVVCAFPTWRQFLVF